MERKAFSKLAIGDIFTPYSDGSEQWIRIANAGMDGYPVNAICLANADAEYFESDDFIYLVSPCKGPMEVE